ncbi:MAG: nucleotidyl transferase AbiEii/AbiGii toxin family protein, partial [Eubacteriales bacterium]
VAQIDVTKSGFTTGDVISPGETQFSFKLLLENRSIEIFAYNLETVLAEKMETIISRGISNTRMRDFYDLTILKILKSERIDYSLLCQAIKATAKNRGSTSLFNNHSEELEKVLNDPEIIRLWGNYRKKFIYAADLEWETVTESIKKLFASAIKC